MGWELDWLKNRARLAPEAEAIADAKTDQIWSYSQIDKRAEAVAAWLVARGIQKGDRVALLSPNNICYFDLLFACGKIGAIFVPLNWRLSIKELKYIFSDASPKLVGFHSDMEHMVTQFCELGSTFNVDNEEYDIITNSGAFISVPVDLGWEDPLEIIYTGGTTGEPKGVVLSHRAILWNGVNTVLSWNLTNSDISITYLPMFHTGGLNALSIPLLVAGGKVVIANDFQPEKAVEYLNSFYCTVALFVPTMYHMMVKTNAFQKSDFPAMKVFLSGGAPCPLEIYDEFRKKGLAFKEGYGLTEAGPNNFYIDPGDAWRKRGSIGKPMLFNSAVILKEDGSNALAGEVGELLIQGKHCFSYYWKNKQATMDALNAGWLHTGDLAKSDEEGFYYIVGRKKEMIISGGENIYPLEIEHWICSHPGVNETAVIGLPDEKWGEAVTAFVVLATSGTITADEIKEFCRDKLAGYKIPKRIYFLEELPKTPVGKIDKKQLKDYAMAGTEKQE
ncbi:long-chain fatty acid--CoA ligase [Bacillus sp. T33-2]|nr:long-chain fatty acid--CoA ligase [Bacillus sp. T33-2]